MRLVTWNCAMGLHQSRKLEALLSLSADIAVIQECSKKSMEFLKEQHNYSTAWFGKNPNKGLGVLVKAPLSIRNCADLGPTWTALLEIEGPVQINLVAVWACKPAIGPSYVGQVHLALDKMALLNLPGHTVVMGDFNSNKIWDHKRKQNHSAVVKRLSDIGLESAYHQITGEQQGHETKKTLFLLRNALSTKHYHIDYVFLTEALLNQMRSVTIGSYEIWSGTGGLSDHAPLIVDIDQMGL